MRSLLSCLFSLTLPAALHAGEVRAWGAFAEPRFPFLESTLDARDAPGLPLPDNLIVRGLILFCGEDTYACYDTDLLRLALVWKGDFLHYRSMAPHTYTHQGEKNQGGQQWLNRPLGEAICATGLHPGGSLPPFRAHDPRPPGPDPREPGRGPVPPSMGVWHGVRITGDRARVEYSLHGVCIAESVRGVPRARAFLRILRIAPAPEPLRIALARLPAAEPVRSSASSLELTGSGGSWHFRLHSTAATLSLDASGVVLLSLPSSEAPRTVRVMVSRDAPPAHPVPAPHSDRSGRYWPETVLTTGIPSKGDGGYRVDTLTLPEPNPWRRQVRTSAIEFLPDGRAALCTFDGDIWILSGIDENLRSLRWRRFASGLHEPQSLHYLDGRLHLYTRNGLTRLHDLDGNGEADWYETLSNRFTQTAETREFASDSVVARDGSFLLAKPGQQSHHQGRDNGSILRITPDGRSERLATGFRQPFLGYHPQRDLLLASDQQGHWVPTTPIHHVREGRFHGFRPSSEVVPPAQAPTEPLCWIPHHVVQSASGLVWVDSDRLGPLSRRFLCLDYHGSRLMLLHLDSPDAPVQAAVSQCPLPLDLPLLKGAVRPRDGWLYLTGFRIWGSGATPWSGLRRLRHAGGPVDFPILVRTVRDGILLGFDRPLDRHIASDPASYHVGRWNYRRSSAYGSGRYRLDGEPGSEGVPLGGIALSRDQRTVWIRIPDMKPVMQMEVLYRLRDKRGRPLAGSAHATVHALRDWDPSRHGFLPEAVLAARRAEERIDADTTAEVVSIKRGHHLYRTMGCMACHSLDGTTAGRSGPSLKGIYNTLRPLADGRARLADADYIRDSLLHPQRNILEAYAEADIGMPSYQGILTPSGIDSLIALIRSAGSE